MIKMQEFKTEADIEAWFEAVAQGLSAAYRQNHTRTHNTSFGTYNNIFDALHRIREELYETLDLKCEPKFASDYLQKLS